LDLFIIKAVRLTGYTYCRSILTEILKSPSHDGDFQDEKHSPLESLAQINVARPIIGI